MRRRGWTDEARAAARASRARNRAFDWGLPSSATWRAVKRANKRYSKAIVKRQRGIGGYAPVTAAFKRFKRLSAKMRTRI